MCPETAFSDTPDSYHIIFNSLQAVLIAYLASKLSTQLRTMSTLSFPKLKCLKKNNNSFHFIFMKKLTREHP